MTDNTTGKISLFHYLENSIALFFLFLLALVPTVEIFLRVAFRTGIQGSSAYIAHLVLWITFLGGMITSREERHLSLTLGMDMLKGRAKSALETITALISASFCWAFAVSSLGMVLLAFSPMHTVGVFPIRVVAIIMPFGYAVMAFRLMGLKRLSASSRRVLLFSIPLGLLLGLSSFVNILYMVLPDPPFVLDSIRETYYLVSGSLYRPFFVLLVIGSLFGVPLFIVLGGISYVLFAGAWGVLEVIPNEAYTMLTGNTIPAIPLFTLAGFILSESKAGERLVALFRTLFGWLPGGLAIVSVLVCAFFTTFTGASGVTILALGGLLSYILVESGNYKEKFANGLVTASGSIGLLFPPSLPIILYGVVAGISIRDMFIGGVVPGFLMVATLSIYGVIVAVRGKSVRKKFEKKELIPSLRASILEVLLPVIILFGYFFGITTIVETGAVAVLYTILIEVFIHKDISFRDLPKVVGKSLPIIGGVLVILAASRGLSYYIVDAEIPMRLTFWVETHVGSKLLFLILLNIALLLTGCLMDIYSAIMVVVPLILPLGELFGIHPVHLGIIFLANLELGYLTPPVGLNLFLASYRFNKPLGKIYRMVVPFFLIRLIAVILITYIPWLSTMLLK